MQSQEKNDLIELSEKFTSDKLKKFVAIADPNEMGKRNLLEIVMFKLSCAYEAEDINNLNAALDIMIDNGLDTSRSVELLKYDSEQLDAPSLLQTVANQEVVVNSTFLKVLEKEKDNLGTQPNSGQNIMIGRIQNGDPAGFKRLLDVKLRLKPDLAEEALKVLTAVCCESDDHQTKQQYSEIAMSLIKMGANLFNVRMFNNTKAFEDVLSEKGYEEVAATIKGIKIECSINQQEIEEVDNAEAIFDTAFSRGL